MKRVSIKDIADAVGLSKASVSIVLSGKNKNGRVGKKTAEKILATAKTMHYQPNFLAQSLQSGKSKTIGLLVADICNPFFALVASKIQTELQKMDYAVIIVNTGEDAGRMDKLIRLLRARQVDGLIVVPTANGEESIQNLVESKIPLVLFDRYFPQFETFNVLANGYKAVFDATKHKIATGKTNIKFFTYNTPLNSIKGRELGYINAMKEAQLDKFIDIVSVDYYHVEKEIKEKIEQFREIEQQQMCIICSSNNVSVSTLQALKEHKVNIGKTVDVICFDNSEVYNFVDGNFVYIEQPTDEMSVKVVSLLMEQINNTDRNNVTHTIEMSCKFMSKTNQ
ncbi:MAG: LacI family DNA-binding transcriptional regulator [Bacteroidaceae bacterium]